MRVVNGLIEQIGPELRRPCYIYSGAFTRQSPIGKPSAGAIRPTPKPALPGKDGVFLPKERALQCSKIRHFCAIATYASRLENPADSIEKSACNSDRAVRGSRKVQSRALRQMRTTTSSALQQYD
jgi:hypothetical protein